IDGTVVMHGQGGEEERRVQAARRRGGNVSHTTGRVLVRAQPFILDPAPRLEIDVLVRRRQADPVEVGEARDQNVIIARALHTIGASPSVPSTNSATPSPHGSGFTSIGGGVSGQSIVTGIVPRIAPLATSRNMMSKLPVCTVPSLVIVTLNGAVAPGATPSHTSGVTSPTASPVV